MTNIFSSNTKAGERPFPFFFQRQGYIPACCKLEPGLWRRGFDRSKIPRREWTYQDDEGVWQCGVLLHPDKGVTFWGERLDGEDAGAYGMNFRDFLRCKDFRSTPAEIISEIRQILEAAKTKKQRLA